MPKGHMDLSVVCNYLKDNKYPQGYSKADKRHVRKRASSFFIKDEEMFYISTQFDADDETCKIVEKLVLQTKEKRWQAIANAHIDEKGNHRGMEKTSNQLTEKFYWVGISAMVREYIRKCVHCQLSRGNVILSTQETPMASTPVLSRGGVILSAQNTPTVLTPMSTPQDSPIVTVVKTNEDEPSEDFSFEMDQGQTDFPELSDMTNIMADQTVRKSVTYFWEKVEMQIFGPFQVTPKKELYVVMFVDVFSLWPEAVVTDYVSPSVVTQFLLTLVARYGLMEALLYRKNEKVEKEDVLPMVGLLESHGLSVALELGRYPELDDIWSAMSKTVNKFVDEKPTDWFHCLDFCLLPHRISRSQQADYTPAFLAHGREPVLPPQMSYRQDLTTDPQLTEYQMDGTINKLFDIYTDYRDDIPPSHLYHGTISLNVWKKFQQTKKQESLSYDEENNEDIFKPRKVINSGMSTSTVQTRSRSATGVYDSSPSTVYSFRHKRRYPESSMKEMTSSPMEIGDVKLKREHSLESLSMDSEEDKAELSSLSKESEEKVDLDFYYQAIYQYKKSNSYPPKSTDYFKRLIRKTTSKHVLNNDVLYYQGERKERIIVMTQKERFDQLRKSHVAKDGSHVPKNKMIDRLSSCFWKGLTLDAEAFVQACPYCNLGSQRSHVSADDKGEIIPVLKEERNPEMDETVRTAEENYTALVNVLKTGKITANNVDNDSIMQIRSKFQLSKKCLYYKEKGKKTSRLVPKTQKEKETYIKAAHVQSVGRHYSPWVTLKQLKEKYIWTDMVKDSEEFVSKCAVCTSVNRTQVRKKVMKTRRSVYQKLFDTEKINDKYLGLSESQIQDIADSEAANTTGKEDKSDIVSASKVSVPEHPKPAANILNLVGLECRVVLDTKNNTETNTELESKSDVENVESVDSMPSDVHMATENYNVTEHTEKVVQTVLEPIDTDAEPAVTLKFESMLDPTCCTVKIEEASSVESFSHPAVTGSQSIQDAADVPMRTVNVHNDPDVVAAVQTIMLEERESILSVDDSVSQLETRYESCDQPSDDNMGRDEPADKEPLGNEVIQIESLTNNSTSEKNPKDAKIERILKMSGKKKKKKNSFKCEYCDSYISGEIKFTAHVYRHTGQKAFQCEDCGKKFTCAKTKRIHMRKHTGNLPFLCNLCGKGFPRSGGLRSHLRTHENGGGISVKCTICDRVFASTNRLQRHVQFKHPVNPTVHKCDKCHKVFSAQRSLKRHKESHHLNLKNHICPYCGKTFFRKEYLTSHLNQHTGEPKRRRHYNPRPNIIFKPVTQAATEKMLTQPVHEVQTNFVPLALSKETSTSDVELQTEIIVTTQESAQQLSASDGEQQVQMYQYYTSEEGAKEEDVIHILSGGGTLLFSTPGVQYEVECESSADQIDAALSAINLLAQASATHTL